MKLVMLGQRELAELRQTICFRTVFCMSHEVIKGLDFTHCFVDDPGAGSRRKLQTLIRAERSGKWK